jgi:hypothetical protein
MTSPLFSQTATFISRGALEGEDDMGEPIYSPEVGVDVPAWYEPVESVEDNRAAQQVITGYNLFVPNWVRDEFGAADKVLLDFDPTEYEVVGDIGYTPDGFITEGYCLAKIEKVKG